MRDYGTTREMMLLINTLRSVLFRKYGLTNLEFAWRYDPATDDVDPHDYVDIVKDGVMVTFDVSRGSDLEYVGEVARALGGKERQ